MTASRPRTVSWLAGVVSVGLILFAACAPAQIALAGSTPEDGASLDGPVRTVRVWFNVAPDVAYSTLELSGPGNGAKIEGLHTMGEKDLMGRVTGLMPNGEWTMTWRTVGADGEARTGDIRFTIERKR